MAGGPEGRPLFLLRLIRVAFGTKRTSRGAPHMSAFDPKRTSSPLSKFSHII